MNPPISALLEKARHTSDLSHEELVRLLSLSDTELPALMAAANEVRQKTVGNQVHLRGIIEFSNYCKQHCCYCGLRADNGAIGRYRLTAEQILETAALAAQTGYRTLVLQSGEDPLIPVETIAELTRAIKKLGMAITLSCGERSYAVYQLWREAGADRYLIKQETADPALYRCIRPGHTLQERLQCQHWLKELGYQVGSGCMIGLPGQTVEILARDLELMKEMQIDMSGMRPFYPPRTNAAEKQHSRQRFHDAEKCWPQPVYTCPGFCRPPQLRWLRSHLRDGNWRCGPAPMSSCPTSVQKNSAAYIKFIQAS